MATIPKMSREQFDHICSVLKKKKIELTPENIVNYMNKTSNQRSKFYKPHFKSEAEKANTLRKQWADFIMTVKFRLKLFGYHFIFYKKGTTGRFWRFDIIKAKPTLVETDNQGR